MRTFLALLSTVGFYGGFAMVAVYFAAFIFLMRSVQLQDFILLYGPEMIYCPMLLCLCAESCKRRLENTPVPGRDSMVAGALGIAGIIGGTFIYTLQHALVFSGVKFAVLLCCAVFALTMSLAFYMKEEISWQKTA